MEKRLMVVRDWRGGWGCRRVARGILEMKLFFIFIEMVVTQIYTSNNKAQNKINIHKCSREVLIAITLDEKNTWGKHMCKIIKSLDNKVRTKMVYLNSTISIIAFNISSLNTSANRQGVSYWIKSKTQATYRKLVKYKETTRSKFEGWKKICLAKLIKKKNLE